MPEEFEPRENDHLVEPMFEALRKPADDEETTRGARGLLWFFVLAVVVIVGSVIVALRACGAGANP